MLPCGCFVAVVIYIVIVVIVVAVVVTIHVNICHTGVNHRVDDVVCYGVVVAV